MLTSPTDLALELRRIWLRLLEWDVAKAAADPIMEQQELPLPQSDPEFEHEQRLAFQLIGDLDRALRDENWSSLATANEVDGDGRACAYGLVPRRAPMREIVRGFLQPVRYLPLVKSVPKRVELFLRIMLPGGNDGLEREEHGGVKWHFHYIDAKHRRSDVMLSFDTRWAIATGARGLDTLRPLFVERHAEGKAKFTAHPGRWKTEKRISMYAICSRDLHKGIEHFRCAKNGSEAVWPPSAMLTPHSSSLPKVGSRSAKVGAAN